MKWIPATSFVLIAVFLAAEVASQEVEPPRPPAGGAEPQHEKEAPAWSEDADLVSDEGEAAMIAIPAGTAKVGLRHNELAEKIEENPRISERRKEETLYRSMKMGALRIDRYEVTNGNYYKFLQTLDEKARKEWEPRHHIRRLAHPQWTDGHYKSGTGNFPVTGIPFEAAEAYAKWRGKRLPTEFEWEYAARGPQGRMFGGGCDEYEPIRLNVADRWGHDQRPQLLAVNDPRMARDVSPFGVIGMGGNVSEWCTSNEIREYNVRDPVSGKIIKNARERFRLAAFRGPDFESAGEFQCLLSFQGYKNPKPRSLQDRLELTLGFRCAK